METGKSRSFIGDLKSRRVSHGGLVHRLSIRIAEDV